MKFKGRAFGASFLLVSFEIIFPLEFNPG